MSPVATHGQFSSIINIYTNNAHNINFYAVYAGNIFDIQSILDCVIHILNYENT